MALLLGAVAYAGSGLGRGQLTRAGRAGQVLEHAVVASLALIATLALT
jgi:hypothetical protein